MNLSDRCRYSGGLRSRFSLVFGARFGPLLALLAGAPLRYAVGPASIFILGALLTGCAHETATTTVRANGSWTRKSVFSIAEDNDAKGGKTVALKDVFAMPSGSGWKVEQKKSDSEPKLVVVTAVKEVTATETVVGDMTVKSAAKAGQVSARVVNSATVRPAGPGRWLYSETFHWIGAKPAVTKDMTRFVRSSVKKALPSPFATDANAHVLSDRLERALWTALFSPPEPLLLDFYDNVLPVPGISDPDERTSVMIRRLGPGIETALEQTFGARMSRDQRHQTAIKLARQITEDTGLQAGKGIKLGGPATNTPGANNETQTFGGLYTVAITLIVKMPGRVVETNGLTDELTGEVYWTLYPQAALERDVTLRAIFDMKGREQQARLR